MAESTDRLQGETMTSRTVLVTGGSGFIAGHIILRLLDQGFAVRATVRALRREPEVRATLTAAGMQRGAALTFVAADLTSDAGWGAAVAGVDAVLHVASPIRLDDVRDENEVIAPARDGTLRVLRAAHRAHVGRVVLTSAFHTVGFGHPHTHGVFTEQDWSVLDGPGIDAYGKSKILAERAAWNFVAGEGAGTELVTMLPVAVMGPVLGTTVSGANHIIQRSLTGRLPAYPDLYVPIVDVRDVAAAHVAAIDAPVAGQRVLVATGEPAMAMRQIGALLREQFGAAAKKVPTRGVPNVVVRLAARLRPELRPVAADLGFVKRVDNTVLRTRLGLTPRPSRDAVIDAARSMLERHLVTT
jgi:nucleoside-diphosphate-sugar epimerase